jgi:beta-mannanase
MNGFWFPWGDTANGNRRGEFVLMWRHIHDIFKTMGVTNVTWVWCPNVNIGGELQPLNQVYPGGRYVDWTCLDGFNWGKRGGSPGWLSFDEIFRKTYSQVIRLAPKKPMMIGETASTDRGGDKAAWIKHTLRAVRTKYRKIRALIWLDVHDRGSNWPIEKPRRVTKTFQKGIRNPAYRPNVFGNLPPVTIEPPRRGR